MSDKPKTTLPWGDAWLLAFIVLDVIFGIWFFYPR